MNRGRRRRRGTGLSLAAAIVLAASGASAQQLDQILRIDQQSTQESAESQQRIDRLSDQTQNLLDEYRTETARIDSLRDYNAQLEKLIRSQQEELDSLGTQLNEVTLIQREIMPLMNRMIEALDQFIDLDIPFLVEERTERVEKLRALMDRADVDPAEKYRRVMEAYQIENDYGRSVEDWQGELDDGRVVDFLRVGRIAFMYLSRDGSEAKVWNPTSGSWEDASDYRNGIANGLRMARDQMAKDRLLTLPVPAPRTSERTVARQADEETEI